MGLLLLRQLVDIARAGGCYKARDRAGTAGADAWVAADERRTPSQVILDCSDANVPFYERAGFRRKEAQLALYFEQ